MSPFAFFHPNYLWFLPAALIPVVLHFLNRRPPKKIEFSSLRFFSKGAVHTSRMHSLRKMLLLVVRCLIIALLVLIFARPYNRFDPFTVFSNSDVSVYMYIDPTISMEYREHGITRSTAAAVFADTLFSEVSPTAKRYLYNEAHESFEIKDRSGFASSNHTRHGPQDIAKMYNAFLESSHGTSMPLLLLVSDFQKTEAAKFESLLQQKIKAPLALVSVAPLAPWNYSIKQVESVLENKSAIKIGVACVGKNMKDASLSVTVQGMRIGHNTISCDKNKNATVITPITATASHDVGVVSLETDDPFLLDNSVWFVRGVSDAVSVLIVGDDKECFPIKTAFASLGKENWLVKTKQASMVTYADIDSAKIVLLCGLNTEPSWLPVLVHTRSFGEKAIVFSPSTDSTTVAIMSRIVPMPKQSSLFYVNLTEPASLMLPDTISVMFRGFPRIKDHDVQVGNYVAGLPGQTIIRLDNGAPLFTQLKDTLGHFWVLSATSIGLAGIGAAKVNNLSETGMYVALIDRLTRHALSGCTNGPAVWTAGIAQKNPFFGEKGGAQILDADNKQIATWSNQSMVLFDKPGCYHILPLSGKAFWIRVVPDSLETEFLYRNPLISQENRSRVRNMTPAQCIEYVRSTKGSGMIVWLWILLGLFLIAEVRLRERWGVGKRKLQ